MLKNNQIQTLATQQTIRPDEFVVRLTEAVSVAYTIMGLRNAPESERKQLVKQLIITLQSDPAYRALTLAEVEYAITAGARGMYESKSLTMCLRNLCIWLDGYLESDLRQQVLRHKQLLANIAMMGKNQPKQITERATMSPRQLDELNMNYINKLYSRYQADKSRGRVDIFGRYKHVFERITKRKIGTLESYFDDCIKAGYTTIFT